MCGDLINQYEEYSGKRARRIIIGRKLQRDLLRQYAKNFQLISFVTRDAPMELFGLEVELNPFIDGIVITGE